MTTLVMARPRQGTVGERERLVHLFDAHHRAANGHLIALCNKRFNPANLEPLNEATGMPCEVCLSRTPRPTHYRELFQREGMLTLNRNEAREPQQNGSPLGVGSPLDAPKCSSVTETTSTNIGASGWNSRKFNPNSDPLRYRYELLADHLARMISTGEISPNNPLPAERRLADEYGVALATARRATKELRVRGLVYTLRSKGTFILPPDNSGY